MAILATEKVLTLDYWKPAEKIQVGDYVFNQTGDLVKVTLVQKYMRRTAIRLPSTTTLLFRATRSSTSRLRTTSTAVGCRCIRAGLSLGVR
jgi:hypothetical protein